MYAQFNRFEIKMTLQQAKNVSHQGRCDSDVIELLKVPAIKNQLKKITPEDIRDVLKEYGAWEDEELKNHENNLERLIWLASCNISEEKEISNG